MIARPQCSIRQCRHFAGARDIGSDPTQPVGAEDDTIVPVCPAFPDGIPYAIAYEDDDPDPHDTVRADQVGTLVYEYSKDVAGW